MKKIIVLALLGSYIAIQAADEKKANYQLFHSIVKSDLDGVAQAIKDGASLNEVYTGRNFNHPTQGETSLTWAVSCVYNAEDRVLKEKGKEIIKLLLQNDADPKQKATSGSDAFEYNQKFFNKRRIKRREKICNEIKELLETFKPSEQKD
jgi:hypothetical protein